MNIFGVGPLEIFFIVLIALIVLGPKDMVKAGRTIGKLLRKVVTSENWGTIQQASQEIKSLPNRLIREAGIDEIQEDLKKNLTIEESTHPKAKASPSQSSSQDLSDWTSPPNTIAPPEVNARVVDDESPESGSSGQSVSSSDSIEDNPPPTNNSEIAKPH